MKDLIGKQDDQYKSFSEESNTPKKNKNEEYFKTLPIRASESYDTLLETNNLSEIALEKNWGKFSYRENSFGKKKRRRSSSKKFSSYELLCQLEEAFKQLFK